MHIIILHFLTIIQYQQKIIRNLLRFICNYIPLKQWSWDDSHSPKYQKFKIDKLPIVIDHRNGWDFALLQEYYHQRYGKPVKPISRRSPDTRVPDSCTCPCCGASSDYIYKNNGSKGQFLCKVCGTTFASSEKQPTLYCPYCGHALVHKKDRKFFRIYKCVNKKCSYYLQNLKHVDNEHLTQPYGKNCYKLHYIYREFVVDFFRMALNSLPVNASSLRFRKHDTHIMGLCLTMHVNLGLSLRKTAQAMHELFNVSISHQQVADYARTASLLVKPFVDNYDYKPSATMVADETYIKVRGIKGYVWFVMDAVSRSILGYHVSALRDTGSCILALRKAFHSLKKLPERFRLIADGYSAYPLAAQQFQMAYGDAFKFAVTQVIGLTNDDDISKEFRPFKQLVERLNRTFKSSYRVRCGYDNYNGASCNVALWVAYYNFLRPHRSMYNHVLNKVTKLDDAQNMPGKWQMLIYLGQQTILRLQEQQHVA